MLLVIADTSPIRYLVQIDQVDLLAQLFEKILLPTIVAEELRHPSAPPAVQSWIKQQPAWVNIVPAPDIDDPGLMALDAGERSAIALGIALKADLILIDERKGAAMAVNKGFETTGTLGILDLAAERGLIELEEAVDRLKQTNFRYRQEIIDALLNRRRGK
jgi:predicted nucleic acid-binding protein